MGMTAKIKNATCISMAVIPITHQGNVSIVKLHINYMIRNAILK